MNHNFFKIFKNLRERENKHDLLKSEQYANV